MSYDHPPGEQPVDPFAQTPIPAPPPPPPRAARWPWIITGCTSIMMVAAIVFAVVTATSNTGGSVGRLGDALSKATDKAKSNSFELREGVCAKIKTNAIDDWAKLERATLNERVESLQGLACSGYAKDLKEGSLRISVATHDSKDAAEKALERRKGQIFSRDLVDVDGTKWDQVQYSASSAGYPTFLVQHRNMELAISLGIGEDKRESADDDEVRKALVALTESVITAVKKAQ